MAKVRSSDEVKSYFISRVGGLVGGWLEIWRWRLISIQVLVEVEVGVELDNTSVLLTEISDALLAIMRLNDTGKIVSLLVTIFTNMYAYLNQTTQNAGKSVQYRAYCVLPFCW